MPETLRRSRTPGAYDDVGPWKEMANTYEWVFQQEYLELRKRSAQKDRDRYAPNGMNQRYVDTQSTNYNDEGKKWMWEQTAYDVDQQARIWMAQEEARRLAALRQAEKERLIQEEVRRVAERIAFKKEQEKRRLIEEKRLAAIEQVREKERQQRRQAERAIATAWKTYDDGWTAIGSSTEKLAFRTIPWPVLRQPNAPAELRPADIAQFILSPFHSVNQTPRDRIKEALRRWHPDRFRRILDRVAANDRAKVEEAAGIIVRCLNDLLSRQSTPPSQVCTCIPAPIQFDLIIFQARIR